MRWEIRYYANDEDFAAKKFCYYEIIEGTKAYAAMWAANRKRTAGYKYAEVLPKY